jgi:hypothetical protein
VRIDRWTVKSDTWLKVGIYATAVTRPLLSGSHVSRKSGEAVLKYGLERHCRDHDPGRSLHRHPVSVNRRIRMTVER